MIPAWIVRPFAAEDAPQLLDLMRALAVFEGYIDAFRVTEADLLSFGLGPQGRFGAVVAAEAASGRLLGMAVHYVIPWTYDMRPTLVLKELFVAEDARGSGVGQGLMNAVIDEARRIGAPRIDWLVLAGNEAAMAFYRGLGGRQDDTWLRWRLDAEGDQHD